MNKFGRYEYVLQRDQIQITKNVYPERALGTLLLFSVLSSAYLLSTTPIRSGNPMISESERLFVFCMKTLLTSVQFILGVVGVFVIQPTTLIIRNENDKIKIGTLPPIPLANLLVVVTSDIISVTFKIVDKEDEVKFAISSSRKKQIDPFINTFAELGLIIASESREQGA